MHMFPHPSIVAHSGLHCQIMQTGYTTQTSSKLYDCQAWASLGPSNETKHTESPARTSQDIPHPKALQTHGVRLTAPRTRTPPRHLHTLHSLQGNGNQASHLIVRLPASKTVACRFFCNRDAAGRELPPWSSACPPAGQFATGRRVLSSRGGSGTSRPAAMSAMRRRHFFGAVWVPHTPLRWTTHTEHRPARGAHPFASWQPVN